MILEIRAKEPSAPKPKKLPQKTVPETFLPPYKQIICYSKKLERKREEMVYVEKGVDKNERGGQNTL